MVGLFSESGCANDNYRLDAPGRYERIAQRDGFTADVSTSS